MLAHAAADCTQSVTALGTGSVQVSFTPATPSTLVDIRYLPNSGGGEQDFRMANNAGVRQQTINGLNPGHLTKIGVNYWYTPASYYTVSPKNDYAAFFHSISLNKRSYAFPYDDVNDQSSVQILGNANPPTDLTLGNGW